MKNYMQFNLIQCEIKISNKENLFQCSMHALLSLKLMVFEKKKKKKALNSFNSFRFNSLLFH